MLCLCAVPMEVQQGEVPIPESEAAPQVPLIATPEAVRSQLHSACRPPAVLATTLVVLKRSPLTWR